MERAAPLSSPSLRGAQRRDLIIVLSTSPPPPHFIRRCFGARDSTILLLSRESGDREGGPFLLVSLVPLNPPSETSSTESRGNAPSLQKLTGGHARSLSRARDSTSGYLARLPEVATAPPFRPPSAPPPFILVRSRRSRQRGAHRVPRKFRLVRYYFIRERGGGGGRRGQGAEGGGERRRRRIAREESFAVAVER